MVFKYSRKGQAAIEFLMTYGWMLLVVLIVGALIFSFVDFGSLLPNQVELSNNLRADATQSFASVNGGISYAIVTFQYNGAQQVKIDETNANSQIVSSINPSETCDLVWVKNVDTDTATGPSASGSGLTATNTASPVVFINGQFGVAEFDCRAINGGSGLFENDVLEGKVTLMVENAKTGVPIPSTGKIRLQVSA
jgi:hypothetical protein